MLRLVGVAIHDQHVLIHKADFEPFWSLPGGRAELMEPSTVGLKREMQEELGTEVNVERMLWVVENFFDFNGNSYHELGLYFLMSFPQDSPLLSRVEPWEGDEEGIKLTFKWHPIADLSNIPLVPSFLCHALGDLPSTTQHIVHLDEAQ